MVTGTLPSIKCFFSGCKKLSKNVGQRDADNKVKCEEEAGESPLWQLAPLERQPVTGKNSSLLQ